MTTVVFRCDAGAVDGLGHVMRSLTLADALKARGAGAVFVCAGGAGQVGAEVAAARGYPVVPAAGRVASPGESEALRRLIAERAAAIVVVDSVSATPGYVEALAKAVFTAAISDGGPMPPAQLVVVPHVGADETQTAPPGTRALFGPAYNLVAPAYFAMARPREPVRRLMISFGGEDPHDHTGWALDTLAGALEGIELLVVIGPAHPSPARIRARAAASPRLRVNEAPKTLAAPVGEADIALVAAGTTCYELAAAGVPMAVIAIEDHQRRLAGRLAALGACLDLGGPDPVDAQVARDALHRLCGDAGLRASLRNAGRALLPAPGAGLVADVLLMEHRAWRSAA